MHETYLNLTAGQQGNKKKEKKINKRSHSYARSNASTEKLLINQMHNILIFKDSLSVICNLNHPFFKKIFF